MFVYSLLFLPFFECKRPKILWHAVVVDYVDIPLDKSGNAFATDNI